MIYKLKNTIKNYDWGDSDSIPKLLGIENVEKKPYAELWLGVHSEGPSEIESEGITLSTLIQENPEKYLGKTEYKNLPFLFKLLAAKKPLSIQAHPNLIQAKKGFDKENQRGISIQDAKRNYKDANHKPEILCAVSNFRVMCGFRELDKIEDLFSIFFNTINLSNPFVEIFQNKKTVSVILCSLLNSIFSLNVEIRNKISESALNCKEIFLKNHPEYTKEWETLLLCAELFSGDAGVLAPLYLNVIELLPNEAIYVPAGVLHTYISGFGVELMANSDNVLRGGLTSKYIDTEELVSILDFSPFNPEILNPQNSKYIIPSKEFALSVFSYEGNDFYSPVKGPAVIIVMSGIVMLQYKNKTTLLRQGESAFISNISSNEEIVFSGTHKFYSAGIGVL